MEENTAKKIIDCGSTENRADSVDYYDPIKDIKNRFTLANKIGNIVTKKRIDKATEYFCVGYFIITFILIGYYILFPAKGMYHSDTTDTIMWAQVALESGSMFDKDFHYACVTPFGGYIFMLPYVAIFGFGLKAHALGMLTFFIAFIAALYIMLKKLDCNNNKCCVITATVVLLISGSTKLREIFWDHIIHYSLNIFFALIGLSLIFSMIDKIERGDKPRKKYIISAVFLFIWCFFTSLNQSITLLMFILPLLCAYVVERLLSNERAKTAYEYYGNLLVPVIIAVASVLGWLVCNGIIDGYDAWYQNEYSIFSSISDWGGNLFGFYIDWYTLFGVDILGMQEIVTIYGVFDLLIVAVATVIFVVPIVMLCNYKKFKSRKMRILLLFHFSLFMFIMVLYFVGRISTVNWRISPIMFTSVLITVIGLAQLPKGSQYKSIANLIAVPVAIIAVFNGTDLMLPHNYGQNSGYFAVAEELENFEQNYGVKLEYGYATYWNSLIVSLINSEEIPIRNINIYTEEYRIYEYQIYDRWFEDQPDVENYFVLVTKDEYEFMKNDRDEIVHGSKGGQPQVFDICDGQYYVLVYDENIF